MNSTTVTFWKPELAITAEPSGLLVAVKATDAAPQAQEQKPKAQRPRLIVSRV